MERVEPRGKYREYADGRMKLEEVVETHVTPLRVKFQRRPTTLPEFNKFRAISK
jgi:hypothetical protein